MLPVREAAELLGHSGDRALRRDLKKGKYESDFEDSPTGRRYVVNLFSLPREVQARYWQAHPEQAPMLHPEVPVEEAEAQMAELERAPEWSRRKAEKYLSLIRASEGLKGHDLKTFLENWNSQNSDLQTSYSRLLDARKRYQAEGIAALLAKYGKTSGDTCVTDQDFAYFKGEYLKEGGPSLYSCWLRTLGRATTLDAAVTEAEFPSYKAFERRLQRDVPESAIYRARHGYSRWYRKYASFVERNWDDLQPNDLWISDHAQIDVMVTLPNGKTCFPWVTVWMDAKSTKMLGWYLHAEAPNSDHIFQAFYRAAVKHGLPQEILIDNGKDYRCRDFSGGRVHTVEVEEKKVVSLVSCLGIRVHFAQPYNAQSKTVERRFLITKEWFSKALPGYRGGNVVERPEILESEIKAGRLVSMAKLTELYNLYITEVYNVLPSQGKILRGESPDAYFAAHAPKPRMIRAEALKMFCTRVTAGKGAEGIVIGRNGVVDSELKLTYWAEWMVAYKGSRVYLRRDVEAYEDAWVFDSKTDAYLGRALLVESINAVVRGGIQKAVLKERLAAKKREEKAMRAFAEEGDRPSPEETLRFLAAGAKALGGTPAALPAPKEVELTEMDAVLAKDRQDAQAGRGEVSKAPRPAKPARQIFTFAFEREAAEKQAKAKRPSGT
jgi:hypothetical protein